MPEPIRKIIRMPHVELTPSLLLRQILEAADQGEIKSIAVCVEYTDDVFDTYLTRMFAQTCCMHVTVLQQRAFHFLDSNRSPDNAKPNV